MEESITDHRKPIEKSMAQKAINRLKHEYLNATKDTDSKISDYLITIISNYQERGEPLRKILEDVGKAIYRFLNIREVSIGLRNPVDGLFRYDAVIGFRKELEIIHRRICYTYDDFFKSDKYKGTEISNYTKIYLAEEQPQSPDVDMTFSRPTLLRREKRLSPDDALEGDYLDVHIYGSNQELLGWIEISGTKNGKLPSISTIKWIELSAIILGVIIENEMKKRK